MKFNRPIWMGFSLFAVIAAGYLYVSQMENRSPVSFQPPTSEDKPERVQKAFDLRATNQKEIASILYSDLSKEEIREKLKPFVKLGDPVGDFTNRTGDRPWYGFGSGPRNPESKSWGYTNGELEIGTDDNGNVSSIARRAKIVNYKLYNHLSIAP